MRKRLLFLQEIKPRLILRLSFKIGLVFICLNRDKYMMMHTTSSSL